jgi:hypothetical protein
MTSLQTPFKSAEDQAKTSWLFLRNCINHSPSSCSRPLPMITVQSGTSSHKGTFFVCSASFTPTFASWASVPVAPSGSSRFSSMTFFEA